MKTPNDTGMNRTGIKASPLDSFAAEMAARAGAPSSLGDSGIAQVRLELAREGEPIGTMPPPASLKGLAKTAVSLLKGESPTLFLNLLGERLAFERTGVRLYQAVIDKLPAFSPSAATGPTVIDLQVLQDEELRHVDVLRRAIEQLGGDPTAMTPAADLAGVAGSGALKVACDPRAQLADSLSALLLAELVDNDAWELLILLARGYGQEDLVASFTQASEEEALHLTRVRGWLTSMVLTEAGVEAALAAPPAP